MKVILLVEDDDLTRIIADNYLSREFRIIPYETATRAIQDMKSYVQAIDIAVIDVIYNDFRNGVDIWRLLRNEGFKGPIVFFTGALFDSKEYKQVLFCINSDRNNSLPSRVLMKPKSLEDLKKCITDCLKYGVPKLANIEQIPKRRRVKQYGY